MSYKINGTRIKAPFPFVIERYNITDAKRLASGTMNIDLIAKKRKFLLTYDVLSGADYDKLLSLVDTNAMIFNFEYIENGRAKSADVYVGPISSKLHRKNQGWYWKDVTLNLIER